MKNIFLLAFAFLLCMFTTVKANNNFNPRDDKEYFSSFKKNEEPKNKVFNVLTKNSKEKGNSYYVIYKENSKGEGFYFKIILDKNDKPVATYYANEGNKKLSDSTIENLKRLTAGPEAKMAPPTETPTQCVTNCHRANKCYDKPTEAGVLLCSLECGIECA